MIFSQFTHARGKTLAGILLVALATTILFAAVGQYAIGNLSEEELNERYDTIALMTEKYFWVDNPGGNGRIRYFSLPEEPQKWVDELLATKENFIKCESTTGLVTGYVPQMNVDNYILHPESGHLSAEVNMGLPYRCAMLEVTLKRISEVPSIQYATYYTECNEEGEYLNGTRVQEDSVRICVATVEGVIGLERSFPSLVGKDIVLVVKTYDDQQFQDLQLKAGQRYLIYGMDYQDLSIKFYTDVIEQATVQYAKSYDDLFPRTLNDTYCDGWFTGRKVPEEIAAAMTVTDLSDFPSMSGKLSRIYQMPTFAKLETTAEDFLKSPEGTLWNQRLAEMEISNHSFPVLAVDKVGYQAAFGREQARIVEGRDFNDQERNAGEKVCIIAQSLAEANGLQVGDTISMRLRSWDKNLGIQAVEVITATNFPMGNIYFENADIQEETGEYRIVGLYRQNDAWENTYDPYGFTPNTIFVPKKAVSIPVIEKDTGLYYTLVLHNGQRDNFLKYQEESEYPGMYECYDGGYGEIHASVKAYHDISLKVLIVGAMAAVAVLSATCLLFGWTQKRNLLLMFHLGTDRSRQIGYLVCYGLGILIPGLILGIIGGNLLRTQVAVKLMEITQSSLPVEQSFLGTSVILCAAEAILFVGISLAVGIFLTSKNGMNQRK